MALRKHIALDLTASREAREKAARRWREPLGLPPEQPTKAERRQEIIQEFAEARSQSVDSDHASYTTAFLFPATIVPLDSRFTLLL